jgi:hypothetical protein
MLNSAPVLDIKPAFARLLDKVAVRLKELIKFQWTKISRNSGLTAQQ